MRHARARTNTHTLGTCRRSLEIERLTHTYHLTLSTMHKHTRTHTHTHTQQTTDPEHFIISSTLTPHLRPCSTRGVRVKGDSLLFCHHQLLWAGVNGITSFAVSLATLAQRAEQKPISKINGSLVGGGGVSITPPPPRNPLGRGEGWGSWSYL